MRDVGVGLTSLKKEFFHVSFSAWDGSGARLARNSTKSATVYFPYGI